MSAYPTSPSRGSSANQDLAFGVSAMASGGIQFGALDRTTTVPVANFASAVDIPVDDETGLDLVDFDARAGFGHVDMVEIEEDPATLRKENFNLKLKVYHLEKNLRAVTSDKVKEFTKLNSNLTAEVKRLAEEVESYKVLLIDSRHAIEQLDGAVAAANNRANDASQKARASDDARAAAEAKLLAVTRDRDELRKQHAAIEHRVAEDTTMASQLATLSRERDAFRDRVAETDANHVLLKQEMERLSQQHQSDQQQWQAKVAALQSQLSQVLQTPTLPQPSLAAQQQSLAIQQQLEAQIKRLEDQLAKERQASAQTQRLLADAVASRDSTALERDAVVLERDALKQRLDHSTVHVQKSEQQAGHEQRPSTSDLRRAERAEAEVKILRSAAEAHLTTVQTLREKMQRLTVLFERRIAAVREEMEQMHAKQVENLEAELIKSMRSDEGSRLTADAMGARNRLIIAVLNHLNAVLNPGKEGAAFVVGEAKTSKFARELSPADLDHPDVFRAVESQLLDALREISTVHTRFQSAIEDLTRSVSLQWSELDARAASVDSAVAHLQRSLAAAIRHQQQQPANSNSSFIGMSRDAEERLRGEVTSLRQALQKEASRASAYLSQLSEANGARAEVGALLEGQRKRVATFQRRLAPPLRVIVARQQHRATDVDAAVEYIVKQVALLSKPIVGDAASGAGKTAGGASAGAETNGDEHAQQQAIQAETENVRLTQLLASREKMLQLVLAKAEELMQKGLVRRDFLEDVLGASASRA